MLTEGRNCFKELFAKPAVQHRRYLPLRLLCGIEVSEAAVFWWGA